MGFERFMSYLGEETNFPQVTTAADLAAAAEKNDRVNSLIRELHNMQIGEVTENDLRLRDSKVNEIQKLISFTGDNTELYTLVKQLH